MTARLYPAQAVLPGHPDKLCDALADALVHQAVTRDPHACCRVEATINRDAIRVFGRLAGSGVEAIDVHAVFQQVYRGAGVEPEQVRLHTDLHCGPLDDRDRASRTTADDQAIVTGYAVDLLGLQDIPAEHWLIVQLLRRLDALRISDPVLGLAGGGQLIVLLEEEDYPTRLAGFSITLPQLLGGLTMAIEKGVKKILADELAHLSRRVPGFDPRLPDALAINITAAAEMPTIGLSGQRAGMDAYGPRVPAANNSLCGKDFYNADRAGVLMARRLARAVVRTGVARECLATMAVVPGQTEAQILQLRGDGQVLDASRWAMLLDRSLAGTGARFTGRESLVDVARFGHFTGERVWERLHFDERISGAP
jgi:S-adenosylmethionine synthetase